MIIMKRFLATHDGPYRNGLIWIWHKKSGSWVRIEFVPRTRRFVGRRYSGPGNIFKLMPPRDVAKLRALLSDKDIALCSAAAIEENAR